ncbi:WAS/WASL-interacting protein family member 3-like [Dermochelys coriacea]|uniref:WAS/WASL-interacting protein family member 3-like n=1 Tax=Dermochelys coriacea TaxID=27794 RepID=UPI001CA851B7|nr:WAS/WASL-interacting protein family member 3-like [Dermochelys coriacea]
MGLPGAPSRWSALSSRAVAAASKPREGAAGRALRDLCPVPAGTSCPAPPDPSCPVRPSRPLLPRAPGPLLPCAPRSCPGCLLPGDLRLAGSLAPAVRLAGAPGHSESHSAAWPLVLALPVPPGQTPAAPLPSGSAALPASGEQQPGGGRSSQRSHPQDGSSFPWCLSGESQGPL